ncbi:MAG: ATP synthase F1 subunit delta [Acidobacteriota bacterium]
MSVETVARRYATALADVVIKTGDANSVKTELKTWEEMISSNGQLQQAFSNPSIAQENKEKVLENLIEKTRPTRTTANFLRVLLRNSRLTEISEINERFDSVLDERSGIVSAQITSARPISDSGKTELETNLNKLTGKKISPNYIVDESIIGGIITRIGSTVYDGSIKTKLEELKLQLING